MDQTQSQYIAENRDSSYIRYPTVKVNIFSYSTFHYYDHTESQVFRAQPEENLSYTSYSAKPKIVRSGAGYKIRCGATRVKLHHPNEDQLCPRHGYVSSHHITDDVSIIFQCETLNMLETTINT